MTVLLLLACTENGFTWLGARREVIDSGVRPSSDDTAAKDTASQVEEPENLPPNPPVIQVLPAEPGTNQPLECRLVEPGSDPEGAELTTSWTWTRDGEPTAEGETVPAASTDIGQSWTCTVTVSDGELDSTPVSETVVIADAVWTEDLTGLSGLVYDASDCAFCPDETWYIPDKAFDDNLGTAANSWVVPWTGGPEWISVDFGQGQERTVSRYGLMGAAFHEGYRARDWEFQGSDNEVDWTTLHSVVDADLVYVMWGGEPFTYYEFSNATPYRYYRLLVSKNMGGQQFNNELGIVEIELFEPAPSE